MAWLPSLSDRVLLLLVRIFSIEKLLGYVHHKIWVVGTMEDHDNLRRPRAQSLAQFEYNTKPQSKLGLQLPRTASVKK